MRIKILRELQKVKARLNHVEDQVAGQKERRDSRERDTKLTTPVKYHRKTDSCKSKSQNVIENSDSSDVPVLQTLRSSKC